MRFFILLVLFAAPVFADEVHTTDYYLQLSDAQLFDLAKSEKIGACFIFDAASCISCACKYYVKSDSVPWAGKGWPINPASHDSTGCVSERAYNGYTNDMATPDLIHNAAAQLRDAISSPSNPCQGKWQSVN